MELEGIWVLVLCLLSGGCVAAETQDACVYVRRTRTQGFEVGNASFVNSKMNIKAIVKEICLILNGETCFPNDLFNHDSAEAKNFLDAKIVPEELIPKPRSKRYARGGPEGVVEMRNSGGTVMDNEDYYAQVKSISCKSGKCNHRNLCDLGEARGDKASIDVDKIRRTNSGSKSSPSAITISIPLVFHLALRFRRLR